MTLGVAYFVSGYIYSMGILVLASLGLERFLVEFYKTFIVKKTPGKFVYKVRHPQAFKKRILFQCIYLISLGLILVKLYQESI